MLISVYSARDGCRLNKALPNKSSRLLLYGCQHPSSFAGGFFVLIKNKDDLT
mgnify:CR=1